MIRRLPRYESFLMPLTRRHFLVVSATIISTAAAAPPPPAPQYGLIGKMKTVPGQREALIAILLEGTANMPGCLSYIIAHDPTDPNAIWITEAWDSKASHQASLALPSVRQAIAKGRPLIAGFGERFETTPVGAHRLAPKP